MGCRRQGPSLNNFELCGAAFARPQAAPAAAITFTAYEAVLKVLLAASAEDAKS